MTFRRVPKHIVIFEHILVDLNLLSPFLKLQIQKILHRILKTLFIISNRCKIMLNIMFTANLLSFLFFKCVKFIEKKRPDIIQIEI